MYVYIKVSEDEFELPECIADTMTELAKLCNVNKGTICRCLKNAEIKKCNSKYKKVDIGEVS